MKCILLVDDDRDTCTFLAELLDAPDRTFVAVQDPQSALKAMRSGAFDLLISDINLNAPANGLDLLRHFRADQNGPVVLISGFGTLETAIDAVRAGAFDYISKPFDIADVRRIVQRALAEGTRQDDLLQMPSGPAGTLIGRTAPMLDVFKKIAHAADSTAPVLIVGESGAGKELVARAIHEHAPRAREPFVAINCGALAETLLESELFGHVRGAFTGAIGDHRGVFEQAGRGTVFLDEIGDTTPALQVRLLRALEEHEVRPVGATRTVRVHARVMAATNVALEQAVSDGRFRQDLYYRLGVLVIQVPPLRDRRADIPLLIGRFLTDACSRADVRKVLSAGALERLLRHPWPGNVRELRNTVERMVVETRSSVIEDVDLAAILRAPVAATATASLPTTASLMSAPPDTGLPPVHVTSDRNAAALGHSPFADLPRLEEIERRYLLHVLKAVGGRRSRAAEVLGIDRRTLYRMVARFGISLED